MTKTLRETLIEREVRHHFAALTLPETLPDGTLPDRATCRLIRRAAAMTQADAARIIGVRQAQVSAWEAGRRNPSGAHAADWLRLVTLLHREVTGR